MKAVATVLEVAMNLLFAATVVWYAVVVDRRLQRHQERLRQLELKTGWLSVQEGPGNKVAVEGKLEALCISRQKDEVPPYAS